MRGLIVGCGYVGMQVGTSLTRLGHEVWGLRRTPAGVDALEAVGIHPVIGDVTAPGSLQAVGIEFDWVVYCVSATGGGPEEYRRVYVEGARNVLEWLRAKPPRRLVYTSSTGVYGQQNAEVVDEESPAAPETVTGDLLVEAERVWLEAAACEGFPSVVLRVAGIYGPGRGYWLRQFISGEARIAGDGSRVLNMIHREDVAGAVATALERGRSGRIYNVVDDEPSTQLEVFQWLTQRLERPLPPSVPADPGTARRRGLTNKRVSNRRLREELGWRPVYPTFREGFEVEIGSSGSI